MSVEGGSGGRVWIVGVVGKCGGCLGWGGKEWWMSVEGARRQVWSQAVTAAV